MTYREIHDLEPECAELELDVLDIDDGALDELVEALREATEDDWLAVPCEQLSGEFAERLAPVSGARCRGCGCRPERTPQDTWYVQDMAAWCPECFGERNS